MALALALAMALAMTMAMANKKMGSYLKSGYPLFIF